MLQITIFMNGATRRYITKTFEPKYDNQNEIEVYNERLRSIDNGNEKVIKFIDEVTKTFISVSPNTCLIEVEKVED